MQLLAEFPELPYVPFGQDSPSMNAAFHDVGEQRARRQTLSLEQKQHILEGYEKNEKSGKRSPHHLVRPRPRGGDRNRRNVPTA